MLFDLPALMVASVILDVEPFFVLFFNVQGYPAHAFFHSYLGASSLALLSIGMVVSLENPLRAIMQVFRLPRKPSFRRIVFSSFIGVYLHVFLDSFLYPDLTPFYPLQGNIFVNMLPADQSSAIIYGFSGIAGILGIAVYWYRLLRESRAKEKQMKTEQEQAKKLTTSGEDNLGEEVEKKDE